MVNYIAHALWAKSPEVTDLKTIVLLFGGTNSEHEVSRSSACSIYTILNKSKYNILPVGITKDGRWLLTEATPEQIRDGSWEELPENRKAVLSPSREDHGLLCLSDNGWEVLRADCVWPVLHGRFGEDGTIQGLCEVAGLPYVGPGVYASAAAMDKSITKRVVESTDIRQARYYLLERDVYLRAASAAITHIHESFEGKYPLFVKPCIAGSSVGVTKVHEFRQLEEAILDALKHDRRCLIEEAIVGREVEVAVLGNRHPEASVVGEVLSAHEFYDYEAKYINAASRTEIPAAITPAEQKVLQKAAIEVYKALDCRGLSRADFFLTEDGTPIFNEINTLPGFTNISMYPKLWEATGLPYEELLDRLIDLALDAQNEIPVL